MVASLDVKTTIELPEELLRRAKASAALRGQSFKDLLIEALRDHLARSAGVAEGQEGWRKVFGRAAASELAEIDRALADFDAIDLESWR
jgi:hypothetical protein